MIYRRSHALPSSVASSIPSPSVDNRCKELSNAAAHIPTSMTLCRTGWWRQLAKARVWRRWTRSCAIGFDHAFGFTQFSQKPFVYFCEVKCTSIEQDYKHACRGFVSCFKAKILFERADSDDDFNPVSPNTSVDNGSSTVMVGGSSSALNAEAEGELIDDFEDNAYEHPFRFCYGSLLQLTIVFLWVRHKSSSWTRKAWRRKQFTGWRSKIVLCVWTLAKTRTLHTSTRTLSEFFSWRVSRQTLTSTVVANQVTLIWVTKSYACTLNGAGFVFPILRSQLEILSLVKISWNQLKVRARITVDCTILCKLCIN